jgi:hypothetical protein
MLTAHLKKFFEDYGSSSILNRKIFKTWLEYIYPENPGPVDLLIWKIGRERCMNPPICEKDHGVCPLSSICDYYNQMYKRYK